MKVIDSLDGFNKAIDSKPLIGILFSSNSCSTCKALSFKLKDRDDFFEVYIDNLPQIVSVTNIYSAPTIAIYFKKKQINVFSGVFSLNDVLDYIERVQNYVYT
ncbi:Thioredoxin [Desulfurella multipotens]|uniref:Thioredoxin n=1 Tax=Desulfurella multipotens TaxID=79269 RepID=A0A1G6LA16_9BACT|nr:thioredoxin family protein [Desulfurella multipotens]SDC40232.1 Thioredoxin [Desulfurella multipotens]